MVARNPNRQFSVVICDTLRFHKPFNFFTSGLVGFAHFISRFGWQLYQYKWVYIWAQFFIFTYKIITLFQGGGKHDIVGRIFVDYASNIVVDDSVIFYKPTVDYVAKFDFDKTSSIVFVIALLEF